MFLTNLSRDNINKVKCSPLVERDLPDGEDVEVPLCYRETLVFHAGQTEAKREDREREGEETGDDEEQRPQSEPDEEANSLNTWGCGVIASLAKAG